MANLAIYRKYRPATFSDVAGQETVTRILRNQIESDHVGHAYLFSGIRGTGKTSIAKILARAVNCEHPVNGEACGECETCKRLKNDNGMNIIEIDAASNRGVDEIRNLRESIKYPPSFGKYKVYIIDEVHMLTKEAFNALLKTLEEPPSHAIFLLATTEAHRLPATILSRCQKFNIKPISDDIIKNRLAQICEIENINIEDKGLTEIARRGEHSMRDALSILDQCADLELPGKRIQLTEIEDFLGIAPKEQLERIARLIAKKNSPELLEAVREFRSQGIEDAILLEDLTHFFQNLLYFKLTGVEDDHYSPVFSEIMGDFTVEELHNIIDVLLKAYSRLRFNALSEIVTDTAMLTLTASESGKAQSKSRKITTHKIVEQPFVIGSSEPDTLKMGVKEAVNQETLKRSANESAQESKETTEPEIEAVKETPVPEKEIKVDSLNNLKENILNLAFERNEKLIHQLIENSDIRVNKNGIFILLDEKHRFMFDTVDFAVKLQQIVQDAVGEPVQVYAKIKQDFEAYLKRKQSKNTNEIDIESEIKKKLGDLKVKYTKKDD